ncbi:bifunctional [glutamine synthetase] adenylyltransferase/[glutamine synthetase]-adenylyl-L-tyrosine phosphorylase [Rhizobium sp. KVB221]|uniref:Bifunctional glutamine synthetase adenylyltransferase/adenylyl-removing enzyme n=1 Tax=Rhizobium setariae TaxID=2801340 RepID=A0A936YR89_9HYPH|nr:bifunctional [glutamine synthetase] adenylyltransferase/[glutamine synthetase]-adenylyl-L-tyrosine phosphorylase [Rhizobium setariae]
MSNSAAASTETLPAAQLSSLPVNPLRPLSQQEAKSVIADLKDWAKGEPAIASLLAGETPDREFVIAALSLSPFLRDIARVDPSLLAVALTTDLRSALRQTVEAVRHTWRDCTEAELMTALRKAKRRAAFLIALADLAKLFDGRETTGWLTDLAEASVAAAIDHLLQASHVAGKVRLVDETQPSKSSGLIVLGMGKLGGRELNYSSDIDVVVFYDPEAGILTEPEDGTDTYARMLRRMIRILQDRTGDGYVFRTDLRLRPDPGSTPLAIPVDAAILYYEGRGQNWERAAYIKARPVAGDIEAGERFLRELVPFVFRKYLDYAAISDIHSIKRQIHVHKGHGEIAVKGHNIKLGRGGIREIEFFAQTQQLIAGGRMPELRSRSTQVALRALEDARWIDAATREELTDAYWFLRSVEHRVQMVHDEQTHILPTTEAELKRIAYMQGYADTSAFSKALTQVLKTVERRYAQLFEQENKLSTDSGNLVFTGQKDDPDTLKTLQKLGFQRPEDMSRTIRGWHYGRYRATQSVEARERLTELMPELLKIFGESKRADEALMRFDQFISGLPSGIQLFSLLSSNPSLLSLLATIMSAAPKLAGIIASKPHVFDGMLDPGLISELPTRAYLAARLTTFLAGATHFEDILDRLRIFAFEQKFLIGIRLLTGAIEGTTAATAFTDLADLVIVETLAAVRTELEAVHGPFPGGQVAIIGMGKLGSGEMTGGSDIDLILLYDYDDEAAESAGPKPIDASRYFSRLTQRLTAALSAPTAEGVLYEVDMRLRPSGNKGPVATRLRTFEKYQFEEAWTWEHMALTRARIIAGDSGLAASAQAIITRVLSRVDNVAKIAADVVEMRQMIDKEKPPRDIWDVKLIAGGLVDIEFIAQFMTLIAPARGLDVRDLDPNTDAVLQRFGAHLMAPADVDTVRASLRLYSDIAQIVRLCIDGPFDPKEAPEGLKELLCQVAEVPDLKVLEGELRQASQAVRKIFKVVVRTVTCQSDPHDNDRATPFARADSHFTAMKLGE